MKTNILLAAFIAIAAFSAPAQNNATPDIDQCVPVVVKTVPEAGSKDVAAGEMELRVTFSKEMMDQAWSPMDAWSGSMPKIVGKPRYDADHRTWIMKAKLEPGKTYGIWLNTAKFTSFQDPERRHAVPYLLAFKTKGQ